MRHLIDLVKYDGEDNGGSSESSGDDGQSGNPSGGCGDGDGCGRR
ncbi:hypothetical protein ACWC0A_01760 [Streptomyces scopuliridis]